MGLTQLAGMATVASGALGVSGIAFGLLAKYREVGLLAFFVVAVLVSLAAAIATYVKVKEIEDGSPETADDLTTEVHLTLGGMCAAIAMAAAVVAGIITSKSGVRDADQPLIPRIFGVGALVLMLVGCAVEGVAAYRLNQ